jgi:uncharacterized protein (TIGR03437 family)
VGDAKGIAVDSSGFVYYSDTVNHRIRRIAPSGIVLTIAGTGQSGFAGDGGPAAEALLNAPYGIAIDKTGALYIADLGNSRVRKIGSDGRITTVAGGGTRPIESGVKAIDAKLDAPRNVAVDDAGNLYVSDFNAHRVYRLAADGQITAFAGSGVQGAGGDTGPALAAQFAFPCGLAIDKSGALYIADSGNRAIRRVAGGIINTVRITSDWAYINLPTGVAVDNFGGLYVASTGFDQAIHIPPSGVPAIVAKGARDVAMDPTGNPITNGGTLYLAAGTFIRKVSTDLVAITLAGVTSQFRGEGVAATTALFKSPSDARADSSGNIYVADTGNHRIRKISLNGTVTTFAGDGEAGYAGDGGPGPQARLNAPQALAVDPAGAVFVADTANHRIRKIIPAGTVSTVAGTGSAGEDDDGRPGVASRLNHPVGIVADPLGVIYFSDTGNNRVRRLSPTGLLQVVAGNGSKGYSGDGGFAAAAQLDGPRGLALDSAGNLYIADSGNHRIRVVTPAGLIITVAGNGVRGFSGDGGPAAQANLDTPIAIAVDSARDLLIADAVNQRIRRVRNDGIISTVAGNGVYGYSGDGGPAQVARLDTPAGLGLLPNGEVLVADRGNNRIRKLLPSGGSTGGPGPVIEIAPTVRALHAATLEAGPVAPGMFLSLQGMAIGPKTPASGTVLPNGLLNTVIDGIQVKFDGRPAPILYAQENLMNVQVPYGVAGQLFTTVEIVSGGTLKDQLTLTVTDAAPGIFTIASGKGLAAAVLQDGSIQSATNPAPRGSLVTLFASGEGQTDPAGIDGKLWDAPFPQPVLPVSVQVGGMPCEVLSSASAAGSPGLLQVTFRLAASLPAGTHPLLLQVGAAASQSGVMVAVR